MAFALLVFQILAVWLITDFPPGLFYWCEDAYGDPLWPIVGEHVTRPNILHHYAPSAIVATSWIVTHERCWPSAASSRFSRGSPGW